MTSRDLLAHDEQARRAAQTTFDRPLVLEAGAGTGKTTTLVARVLSWALGPGWVEAAESLENGRRRRVHDRRESIAEAVLKGVVAITFTEAAAAEMAARVAQGFAAVAAGESETLPGFDAGLIEDADQDTLARRARTLLGHLDQLEVRTIHAFCHSRLTRHPLELGLHPEFRIDPEKREIEEVVRTVVEQQTRRAYAGSGDSPLLDAAALGIGPQKLASGILDLIDRAVPSSALAGDPFSPSAVGRSVSDLVALTDEFLAIAGERLHSVTRGGKARQVAAALEQTRDVALELDTEDAEAVDKLIDRLAPLWQDKQLDRLAHWSRGPRNFSKSEAEALGERLAQLIPLCRPLRNRIRHLINLEPERLRTFRAAVAPILEETETALKARGLIHFAQILIDTRRLFDDSPDVLALERSKIRQLLVDEFQDTDVVQCAIVTRLAFGDDKTPDPGLFVVGDPKQSIYGWRNADLSAYEDFLAAVRAHGGETYPLVQNFRSAPVLLEEVERSIRPIMAERPGLQPGFTELLPSDRTRASTGFTDDGWAPVESWVSWSRDAVLGGTLKTSSTEAAEIEADAVARDIVTLHEDRQVPWNHFGVLFRSANRLDMFLEAFRRAGVPFVVARDKQYFRRREVIEAAALLRLIVNPNDQVALLSALRSPLFGVPDAALIPLWAREFPRLFIELVTSGAGSEELGAAAAAAAAEIPNDIPGIDGLRGWEANLLYGVDSVRSLRESLQTDPADRFVERLRRTTLLEAGEAARFLGQYRIANLERFFRRLQLSLEESGGDIQAVLRGLKRSVNEAHEAEEALPKDAAEDAVQVMTIHKAKGLEFNHVYLVQLDAGSPAGESTDTDADRRWGPNGPEEYSLFGAPTLGFDRVNEHRERVAAAEQVRILYVALTRARERLVLAGNWKDTRGTRLGNTTPTFLALLDQRQDLPESLPDLATQAIRDGWEDKNGIRWKFPGLAADESTHRYLTKSVDLPGAAEVRAAASRLSELADGAARQMARPLIGVASLAANPEAKPSPTGEAPVGQNVRRSIAMEIGTAIHQALEDWDLDSNVQTESRRQRDRIEEQLGARLAGSQLDDARARVEAILDSLASGTILADLVRRREAIVARELPILLPSAPDRDDGPVAGVSGVIDLVLEDPESGALTVVDYKTDQLGADENIDDHAARYAPQLATYAAALQQALDLPEPPGAELWFVGSDRVWRSS